MQGEREYSYNVNQTSVRKIAGLSRHEQIAALRSRMAELEGDAPKVTGDSLSAGEIDRILPGGGLARQAVTEVSDTPALIVEIIRHVRGHIAIVGWPELSLAGIEHLDNIIVVPEPGEDPLGITSVLVEGLDLVVWRSPVVRNLSPVRARPLLGRLKKGHAALVTVGVQVPSPAARLEAAVTAYRGIGQGTGRITGYDIAVAETTRRARMTLTVGEAPRLRVV